jgi:hypothetical protein
MESPANQVTELGQAPSWLLAASAFLAIGIGLLLVAILRRERPAGRWLAVASILAPLGTLTCVAMGLQHARATALSSAQPSASPDLRAALLSQGLSADVLLRLLGGPLVLVALVVGVLAGGLAVARRSRSSGVLTAGIPLAFVVLGFAPLAAAAFFGAGQSNRGLVEMSSLAPEDKPAHLVRVIDSEQRLLDRAFQLAAAGCVLAALLGCGLAWKLRSPATAGQPTAARTSWGGSVILLATAGVATALAVPLRRENAVPWPPPSSAGDLLLIEAETPALEGPDAIERAPVIVLDRDLVLDGQAMDPGELEQVLAVLRNNYHLLHPGGEFNGLVLLVCAPAVTGTRVREVLQAVHVAGYRQTLLTFIRIEQHQRPTLGTLKRNRTTSARVQLVQQGGALPPGSRAITLDGRENYAELARRAVEGRREGAPVALLLP